jgi:hypothetical protein
LLTLVAFIVLVHAGFRSVRRGLIQHGGDEARQKMQWAWGSVLFSHCVSFFGVSYFGQMNYFWYLTLGIIASLPYLTEQKAEDECSTLFAEASNANTGLPLSQGSTPYRMP